MSIELHATGTLVEQVQQPHSIGIVRDTLILISFAGHCDSDRIRIELGGLIRIRQRQHAVFEVCPLASRRSDHQCGPSGRLPWSQALIGRNGITQIDDERVTEICATGSIGWPSNCSRGSSSSMRGTSRSYWPVFVIVTSYATASSNRVDREVEKSTSTSEEKSEMVRKAEAKGAASGTPVATLDGRADEQLELVGRQGTEGKQDSPAGRVVRHTARRQFTCVLTDQLEVGGIEDGVRVTGVGGPHVVVEGNGYNAERERHNTVRRRTGVDDLRARSGLMTSIWCDWLSRMRPSGVASTMSPRVPPVAIGVRCNVTRSTIVSSLPPPGRTPLFCDTNSRSARSLPAGRTQSNQPVNRNEA